MVLINESDVLTTGVDEDAFVLLDDDAAFQNLASITTVGVHADAVVALADRVAVTNSGVIDVSGLGAAGVFAVGDDAQVVNDIAGSIVTRGGVSDQGTLDPLDDLFPNALSVFGDRFSILNDGSIVAEGPRGSAILAVGDGGSVTSNGTVSSLGGGADFTVGVFGVDNRVVNLGQITAVGAAGILFEGEGGSAINRGTITTDGYYAIGMRAQGADITLDNRADIITTGEYGIGIAHGVDQFGYNPSTGARIISSGDITTTGTGAVGIMMIGDGGILTVTGLVKCLGGLAEGGPLGPLHGSAVIAAGDGILVNADGRLLGKEANTAAIYLNVTDGISGLAPEETLTATLINTKVIHGGSAGAAIICGDGRETVANSYHIAGLVDLGGGDDVYQARFGGRLDGAIVLGKGDDLIDVDLYGGTLKVRDFRAGEGSDDRIDLTAFGLDGLQDVIDAARQVGDSVRIGLEGTRIFLSGLTIGDLVADDFIF